jgi:hypothetical protein
MKKYVCPMGCVEPQNQSRNCSEGGIKLLPTDELGFETDQFGFKKDKKGLTTTDQFGLKTDQYGYKINKNPHESVPDPYKSVGTYLYFIECHIPIEVIEKLLTEKPEIDGIALSEIPSGYPGMSGFKLSPFKIHSVKNGQDQGIFMEI